MRAALALILLAACLTAGCALGGDGTERSAPAGGSEPPFDTAGWRTDFARHSVPLDEFVGGGPPKDGIPAIDEPRFVDARRADRYLSPSEPVAVLELGGRVRAYPIQILTWHEIVNDELGGRPVAVTFCPLCNSTVAFDRRVGGRTLDFGTTGMLRNSDLVMYDRQTESWWQQLTAEAVVGELTGERLDVLPSLILAWSEVIRLHPGAEVLSRDTGFSRDYGANPYTAYDADPDSAPFALRGEPDRSLPPKERVAAVRAGAEAIVYPFSVLADRAPVNDEIAGEPVVVLFDPRAASALDRSQLSESRAVGSAAVYERTLDGRQLSFEPGGRPGEFRDAQTGSTWTMDGRATAGELAGERLDAVAHDDQFWFALAAFFPEAEIRR